MRTIPVLAIAVLLLTLVALAVPTPKDGDGMEGAQEMMPPAEIVRNSIPLELDPDQFGDGPVPTSGVQGHGVFYTTPQPASMSSIPRPVSIQRELVVVLVEQGLLPQLNASILQYADDLEVSGYSVKVYNGTWTEAHTVRALLKGELSNGMVGAVLVGDIVEAWYEILNGPASWGTQEFPTDLYYTDLDGSWADADDDGLMDNHTRSVDPEIWLGRLRPSVLGDEVDLLRNYFRKNHEYRTGNLTLPHRSLVYVDEDWTSWSYEWNDSVARIYNDSTLINDADGDATNKADYMERLTHDYEWIHVGVHSGPTTHRFKVDGQWLSNQTFYSTELRTIDPHAHFYNLWACSNARYTVHNCMGSQYVFADTYGLLSIGSTKTGGMINQDSFYEPLASNITIGEAFQEWFKEEAQSNRNWTYGMVILGDPTLTTIHDLHAISPQVTSPTHPDPLEIYSNSTAILEWETPRDMAGIAGYYYSLDLFSDTVPDPASATWTTSNSATFQHLREGHWYFHIISVDTLGNIGRVPTHFSILLDTTPPTASIVIDDDATYTTDLEVGVRIGSHDNFGVALMRFSQDGVDWEDWMPIGGTHDITLEVGDGERKVHLQVIDHGGLISEGEVSDTIILDTTPPKGTIAVQAKDGYSNHADVIVYITGEDANGVTSMSFGDDGMIWGGWRPFSPSTRWAVRHGDGPKTVHLQLMDAAGVVSTEPMNVSFILDTTPPEASITINDGAMYTTSKNITVAIDVVDQGPVDWYRMEMSEGVWSDWSPFSPVLFIALAGEDDIYTMTIEVRDRAGNVCPSPVSSSIILDTTPPSGTVTIDGDAPYTTDLEVDVRVTAFDMNGVSHMSIRTGEGTWSPWEPIAADLLMSVPEGDGTKRVEVRFMDVAGLVSEGDIADLIVLDTTPPSGTLTIDGPDPYYTNSNPVTLILSDEPSGDALEMMFKVLAGEWSDWEPFSTSRTIHLDDLEGLQTVYVLFRDRAGLVTPQPIGLDLHLDTEVPIVDIEGFPPEWSTKEDDVTYMLHLFSEAGGSPLALYGVSLDPEGPWTEYQLDLTSDTMESITLDWPRLDDGRYPVYFHVVDIAGNEGVVFTTFSKDSEGPIASLDPTARNAASSTVRVQWDSLDNVSGIASILLFVDGGDPIDVTGKTEHRVADLLNGEHSLRLVVTDEAGNVVQTTSAVEVDAGFLNSEGSFLTLTLLVVAIVAIAGAVMWSLARGRSGK